MSSSRYEDAWRNDTVQDCLIGEDLSSQDLNDLWDVLTGDSKASAMSTW